MSSNNNSKIIIAPSILAADLSCLGKELASIEDSAAEWIHLDVMDGQFVPPITFGDNMIHTCKKLSKKYRDVHLMINKPEKELKRFIQAGSNNITFHIEATTQADEIIKEIKANNISSGISIKPNTPIESIEQYLDVVDLILVMTVEPGFGGQSFIHETLDKIHNINLLLQERGLTTPIQVDGGINAETARLCQEAGASNFVAGTYIFGANDRHAAINKLLLTKTAQ